MRNENSKCQCGKISCDAENDMATLLEGIVLQASSMIELIEYRSDPRRDQPRISGFSISMNPSSEGFYSSTLLMKMSAIGISKETAGLIREDFETFKKEIEGDNPKMDSRIIETKNGLEVVSGSLYLTNK